jgi:ATP-dependent RNA helicase DeaD
VQVAKARAGGLGDGVELDRGLVLRRVEGEPALEPRPRAPYRKAERRPGFDPARETEAGESGRPAPGKTQGKSAAPGPARKAPKSFGPSRTGKPGDAGGPTNRKGKPRPPRGA